MKDKNPAFGNKGQSLPVVLIIAGAMAILATTMVTLFRQEVKTMVRSNCMLQKQELASIALEHAIYKIQQEDNWFTIPDCCPKFYAYSNKFTSSLGDYWIHLANGNLFLKDLANPFSRQAQQEYKTIGIKIKVKPDDLQCTASYFAVVERKTLGGPLVSAGKIDLPCTDAKVDDSNFYWGDIFSANTNTGYCRIPKVSTSKGAPRQPWLPKVYSAADIYTAVGFTGGRTGSYIFASSYEDMSPTANSHPYSAYATAPEIDFDYYRGLARDNGAYYGPANIPGIGANKFYIADGRHNTYNVVQAEAVTIMAKLRNVSSVLFIDTTDGLPLRENPCNSYSKCVTVTPNMATDKTLRFYVDNNNQYFTNGRIFVMGPLMLIGDVPSNIANTAGYSWSYGGNTSTAGADEVWNVKCPDNYYFPQANGNDGDHYYRNSVDERQSRLYNVKHSGLIYTAGELRIGGPRVGSTNVSNICIYGTILLGELGVLKMDTVNDNPLLFVYYNKDVNVFGMQGSTVALVSFSELSFLIPTPDASPYY